MATTISSQLQIIKSFTQVQSESTKKPFTRPSIIFDPREAADIGIETLFNIAISGLEALINVDERFKNYRNDLFSHKSMEVDREMFGVEENKHINATIGSYLRLLSGHLQLHYAVKTLEYLIRKYKIHVYNVEDLILCALPYHDTHTFVKIVQLLDIRNSKWTFLTGIKTSGAPAPRSVIVQQCIRDKGVFDDLCSYASSSRKFQTSRPVVCFFTVVAIEVLGSTAKIKNDLIRGILPFIDSSLKSPKASSDHKASALMLTVLLASKVTLSPKLVNGLLKSVCEVARGFSRELEDIEWLHMSVISLVNLVQSQHVQIVPDKAMELLKEIQDFTGILIELFKSFNIERFIIIFMDSLVLISSGDDWYLQTILSIIEKIPMKGLLNHSVFKVIRHCMRLYQKTGDSAFHGTGMIGSQKILSAINKCYPFEFGQAILKAMEDPKLGWKENLSGIFGRLLDSNLDTSDLKLWIPLEHPKAEISCDALSKLDMNDNMEVGNTFSQKLNHTSISSLNMDTICSLSESLLVDHVENFPLFSELFNKLMPSTTLAFLVLLRSFSVEKTGIASQIVMLIEASFPHLKSFFMEFETAGKMEKFCPGRLDHDCQWYLDHLHQKNIEELNVEILVSLFWKVSESLILIEPPLDCSEVWECIFRDLLSFFMTSRSNHIFKKHLHFLISECKVPHASVILKFFTKEDVPVNIQIESLHCFEYLCLNDEWGLTSQLLNAFPSLLVPLFNDNQDVRVAAMNCIEGVHTMFLTANLSAVESELVAAWNKFLKDLLGLIIEHKRLILSDRTYISELFTSLLSASCDSFVAPRDLYKRYQFREKEDILNIILSSALKLSAYGKLRILFILRGLGNKIMHNKEVQSLFSTLMERQQQGHKDLDLMSDKLSATEIELLCLLFEMSTDMPSFGELTYIDCILKVLQVENSVICDPTLVQPCVTVLNKICDQFYKGLNTNIQEILFKQLVILFRSEIGEIQNATKDALLRINITSATMCNVLSFVIEPEIMNFGVKHMKKKKRSSLKNHQKQNNLFCNGEIRPTFINSFLDILILKKDLDNKRYCLAKPLFKLFLKTLGEKWTGFFEECKDNSLTGNMVCQIQHAILYILQGIVASLTVDDQMDDTINELDIDLLVDFAQSTMDAVTRNHVFSLLSTIARVRREKVLGHTVNIISIVGASTLERFDRQSQSVAEGLMSELVPYWLARTNKIEDLLQVFIDILPDAASHKRGSIITYLMRILGPSCSLGPFIFLLFHSLTSRKKLPVFFNEDGFDIQHIFREWEYDFALEIAGQFSFLIWLPSLVKHLQKTPNENQMLGEFLLSMKFILKKLQGPEFSFQVESCQSVDDVQKVLGQLMDLIVTHSYHFESKKKSGNVPKIIRRELGDCLHQLLSTVTHVMMPASFFQSITKSLVQGDRNIGKKALGILCKALQKHEPAERKKRRKKLLNSGPTEWFELDENGRQYLENMCFEISKLIDDSSYSTSLILAAVSALEVLCIKFPENQTVFKLCLSSVVSNIKAGPLATTCLRAAGALIRVLGPASLPDLPYLMRVVFDTYLKNNSKSKSLGEHICDESNALALLLLLEAVVDSLGSFLSPYVGDLVKLLVLHPSFTSACDVKVKAKADFVRRTLAEKVPIRHLMSPILGVCHEAVDFGDSSVFLIFEMLVRVVSVMDKASVAENHGKIFDVCLVALNLRFCHPASIKNVDAIEVKVIDAVVGLTLKLREVQFKPLFFKGLEWAEMDEADSGLEDDTERMRIYRGISFYGLVHRLVESHRILFVPYFKHFVEASVRHLTCTQEHRTIGPIRKRKKSKIHATDGSPNPEKGTLSPEQWHLRYLVLSSLHRCFVYDTGHLQFLDSATFQTLVKPIVSQLSVEPPVCLGGDDNTSGIPSVEEMDDLLVSCIGQMTVTCGSDLLWKSLNHEVLMQTRNEGVRAKMVGLRTVKEMVEKVKEEYMVMVAETIPFLAELLEDVEPPVRNLSQQLILLLESISGENLRHYL